VASAVSLTHSDSSTRAHHHPLSVGGLLIALGIIYGDIGTSPLYVLKAIIGEAPITERLVYGAISCILWTLTFQTTIKYVITTLQADNNGEGGIFSLYTLVRRQAKWLYIPAIIGGAALLADGIITPPISVSSAIEGLQTVYPDLTQQSVMYIVIAILVALFLFQSLGTQVVGKAFGPIMLVWFSMLAVLGVMHISDHPGILKALNPYYAYDLLVNYPGGFWLLGGVFLCTTGAEALYSDLGHCGKGNIRFSWGFVKSCLILNYLGQGAWLMAHEGAFLKGLPNGNPFYALMPDWFLMAGIVIATMATIIASQALITGSFTLISEAIRLNMWPRVRLHYPTNVKGQLYVPSINRLLLLGCIGVVLYFKESGAMEAAYGLAITLTMLMTTVLLSYWLYKKVHHKRLDWAIVGGFLAQYLVVEGAFLVANLDKFPHGGWVSLLIGGVLVSVMFVWLKAADIKKSVTEFVSMAPYIEKLRELSRDESVAKYSTHLVFMSGAEDPTQIESKIIYSIFQKRPKRADVYWFLHVDTTDEPYTMEYKVVELASNDAYRINFRLGFRVEQRINLYFRRVIEDLVRNKEVDITSRYDSLSRQQVTGDFRFVVMERYLSDENELPFFQSFIMQAYFYIRQFISSETKYFGLDTASVKVERVPLLLTMTRKIGDLKRVY
jgi:KUP system potassium uptake protein